MSKAVIVAVNKKTGSKYTRCDCKHGVCKVQSVNSSGGYWTVDQKSIQKVK